MKVLRRLIVTSLFSPPFFSSYSSVLTYSSVL